MATRKMKTDAGHGTNPTTLVDAFLARLAHPRKAEIEAVRTIILSADARIRETIKWNAPSFYTSEHFATFRLQPHNMVQVVLHTGAKVKSTSTTMNIDAPPDLVTWVAKDRCTVTFADMSDVKAKEATLQAIVQQWIEQM